MGPRHLDLAVDGGVGAFRISGVAPGAMQDKTVRTTMVSHVLDAACRS